jgi:hypothetical protein
MESLAELRAFQCRLTPDRALRSVDEAEEFLRDRGMLTRTTDGALPSLYEACQEDPYRIGAPTSRHGRRRNGRGSASSLGAAT